MQYWKPEPFTDTEGEPRKVGFELEFGNVACGDAAQALQEELGGELVEVNPYVYKLEDSSLGTVKVERDAQLLNSVKYREVLSKLNVDFSPGLKAYELEKDFDRLSSVLVPCEVVTQPLAFEAFAGVEQVVDVLSSLHAEGSQDSLLNAYGLHLNPSMPDLETETFVRYMQAFLLLNEWLEVEAEVDFTRRIVTNYIDPFPDRYSQLVLDGKYQPDFATFLKHYLEHNPTRNRALDLLPALGERDMDAVRRGVLEEEKTLLNSRPALHYRLPDCRIGDPGWSVSQEWNRWWHVEALAGDDALRAELIRLWWVNTESSLLLRKKRWVETVSDYLAENLSAPREVDG